MITEYCYSVITEQFIICYDIVAVTEDKMESYLMSCNSLMNESLKYLFIIIL